MTTVRVPASEFELLLEQVCVGVEEFDTKTITASDVTEQFVDIKARLKTKKNVEERFMALLLKARTIEEILHIERKIGNIRAEIESAEGKLKVMRNQIGYSTLTITYYQPKPQSEVAFGFLGRMTDAVSSGWEMLLLIIIGLTHVWPLLLLAGGAIYFVYKRRIARTKSNR